MKAKKFFHNPNNVLKSKSFHHIPFKLYRAIARYISLCIAVGYQLDKLFGTQQKDVKHIKEEIEEKVCVGINE